MTFQKGILISNLSLRNLYKDLKDYIGIEYIITRRLNRAFLKYIICVQMDTQLRLVGHPVMK